jgi:hypothetical protein
LKLKGSGCGLWYSCIKNPGVQLGWNVFCYFTLSY